MDQDADFKQWIQNAQEVESYLKEILRDYEALQEIEWFIHSHISSLKEDSLLYQIKEKGDVLQKFSYRAFDYIHHLIRMLSLLETKKWEDELLFSDAPKNLFEKSQENDLEEVE